MSIFYIRNSLGNISEDGTESLPFKSLSSLVSTIGSDLTGHTLRFYGQDTFDERVGLASFSLIGNNFTVEAYRPPLDNTSRPTLTRAKRDFTWESVGSGVWRSVETVPAEAGVTGLNCISEDGIMMAPVFMATSEAATILAMLPGTYSINPVTNKMLICPSSGAPANHYYIAGAGNYAPIRIRNAHSYNVREIIQEYCGGAQFGGTGVNATLGGAIYEDLIVRNMGGHKQGATITGVSSEYSGDGLSTFGCNDDYGKTLIRNSEIHNIFDQGSAPQTYTTESVSGVVFENVDIHHCGMGGVAFVVIVGAGIASTVNRCGIKKSRIYDNGYGWSGNRGAYGMYVFNASDPYVNTSLNDNFALDNAISHCAGTGLMLSQTSGRRNHINKNFVTGCATGFRLHARQDAQIEGIDDDISFNIAKDCTTGFKVTSGTSGLPGARHWVKNNTMINCITGIDDQAKAGEFVDITNNLVVNCGTGIKTAGTSTLTKNTNNLSGCTTNYAGGLTQGTDTLTSVALDDNYMPTPALNNGTKLGLTDDYYGNACNGAIGAVAKSSNKITSIINQ